MKSHMYHDIISSSETLFAKLANTSEGVNTMNTTYKTRKPKTKKKKSLLFNSNRIWIPHSKRATHLLILTVKSEINGRPLASCYRISHDKYLFFTLNMYCYMYIYKRYLIFKVINNLFNRAWIRYLVQRFPKIWWKKIIEILSSHESSQCTNK